MNWRWVRDKVEGEALTVRAGLASGKSLFVAILSESPELEALVDFLSSGPAALGIAVRRVKELVDSRFDDRYENPWDTALCAYLLAIERVDRDVACLAAEIVLNARQTWWASKVALALLAPAAVLDSISLSVLVPAPAFTITTFESTGSPRAASCSVFGALSARVEQPTLLPTGSYSAPSFQESLPMHFDRIGPSQRFVGIPGALGSGTQFLELAA